MKKRSLSDASTWAQFALAGAILVGSTAFWLGVGRAEAVGVDVRATARVLSSEVKGLAGELGRLREWMKQEADRNRDLAERVARLEQ